VLKINEDEKVVKGGHEKLLRKVNKKMLGIIPVLLMFLAFLSVALVSGDVEVTTEKYTGITIDGMIGDWAGVPGTTITLIRPLATTERIVNGLEIRTAYDDSNIYILVLITDDYDYNATDDHKSGAIAVLFAIDEAATPDMGGGKGYVDIWHWELDVGPGVVTGFNLASGNDPVGNLDDEYALDVMDRHDDATANEIYGAWSHTNMSAVGAKGTWIFEFKRSLTTSDTLKQDKQFEIGKTYKVAVAYWDADELGEPGVNNGWTDAGHYATCKDPATLDFSWINMELKTPTIEGDVENLQTDVQDLHDDVHDEISQLTGQIDSLTTMLYAAIGVAVVGILIGIAAVVFARKKT